MNSSILFEVEGGRGAWVLFILFFYKKNLLFFYTFEGGRGHGFF